MKIDISEITAIPSLVHWRKEIIENVYGVAPSKRLLVAIRRYYRQYTADGSHIAIVAERNNIAVGCGAICLLNELPSPDNPSGRCAYLTNIYVRERYRGQGICHAIVAWLVDRAKKEECGKIWIETTDCARSLYQGIGFNESSGVMEYVDIHNF